MRQIQRIGQTDIQEKALIVFSDKPSFCREQREDVSLDRTGSWRKERNDFAFEGDDSPADDTGMRPLLFRELGNDITVQQHFTIAGNIVDGSQCQSPDDIWALQLGCQIIQVDVEQSIAV